MATRKVRYKKLSVKTLLGVLREEQIDPAEYESLTNEAQIATGVEQAEENVSRNLSSSRHGHVLVHVPHILFEFGRGLILTLIPPGIPSPGCSAERGRRC
jgi:hypothetical protein